MSGLKNNQGSCPLHKDLMWRELFALMNESFLYRMTMVANCLLEGRASFGIGQVETTEPLEPFSERIVAMRAVLH